MSAPFLFVTFSPLAKDDDLVDANARPPSPLTGRPVGGRQDESHKACHDDTAVPGARFAAAVAQCRPGASQSPSWSASEQAQGRARIVKLPVIVLLCWAARVLNRRSW